MTIEEKIKEILCANCYRIPDCVDEGNMECTYKGRVASKILSLYRIEVPSMPIILGVSKKWTEKIPFSMLNEEWAKRNHQQTLNRLAERGGLSPSEAIAIMDKRKWLAMPDKAALDILSKRLNAKLGELRIEIDCPKCEGKGNKVKVLGFPVSEIQECPNCQGTGKITKIPESGDVGIIK